MKFVSLITSAFIISVSLASCDSANKEVKEDLARLDTYLDSVRDAKSAYTEEGWANIKTEYNKTIDRVQAGGKELSDDANKKLEEVKTEYNKLKDDYAVHIRDKKNEEANSYKLNLRKSLFGDDNVGSDMQLNFVTSKNALAVYDRFVNTVKENQNKYSREDWDEIKVLYEALDTRKNEIEKDLANSDNLKIARRKVEFAAIKSVKRPFSKIEENESAKKEG
jgi:hypothetical protein